MSATPLTEADARALRDCLATGGVAVFPADTVYGLACDPCSREALARIYELKGRPAAKPTAVMWFSLPSALGELEHLQPRTRLAVRALLPGPVTLLLPNPRRRFPLACEPGGTSASPPPPLGLRVPSWPTKLAELQAVQVPALQSSANLSGGQAPRCLSEVPKAMREGADLVLDGGELPGVASTVIDFSAYDAGGTWRVVRQGALSEAEVAKLLAGKAH